MRKLLTFLLAFVVLSSVITPSVEAKMLNKELVNKVTLDTGYKILVCPVKITSGEINSLGSLTASELSYFNNPEQLSCFGDEQTLVFGDVHVDLKDGSKTYEHIILFDDLILREDSLFFSYYDDGSRGGNFIQGDGTALITKLKYVQATSLLNTDQKLPNGQLALAGSGLIQHYDPNGQIDMMLFALKGNVYKFTKTINKANDVVLVDYTNEKVSETLTPIIDTSTWKTYQGKVLPIEFNIPQEWKTNEQEGGTLNYGDYGVINTSISADDSKRTLSITKKFFGGFGPSKTIKEEDIMISGIEAKKILLQLGNDMQININFDYKNDPYLIITSWNKDDIQAESIFGQIFSTIKFVQ